MLALPKFNSFQKAVSKSNSKSKPKPKIKNNYKADVKKDIKTKYNLKYVEERNEEVKIAKEIVKNMSKKQILPYPELNPKNSKNTINLNNPLKDIAENIPKNQQYIQRRYQSTRIKARVQTEKIKNLLNKVDNYLLTVDPKKSRIYDNLEEQARTEIESDTYKSKAPSNIIDKITNRLYQHKKKDAEQIEKNREFISNFKSRPKSVFKVTSAALTNQGTIPENLIKKHNLAKLLKLPNIVEKIKLNEDENVNIDKINNNTGNLGKKQRIKSAINLFKGKVKDVINENEQKKTYEAEIEVKKLVRKHGYDLILLNQFQKNNKNIDISSYIHKAQIKLVKDNSGMKFRKQIEDADNRENIKYEIFKAQRLIDGDKENDELDISDIKKKKDTLNEENEDNEDNEENEDNEDNEENEDNDDNEDNDNSEAKITKNTVITKQDNKSKTNNVIKNNISLNKKKKKNIFHEESLDNADQAIPNIEDHEKSIKSNKNSSINKIKKNSHPIKNISSKINKAYVWSCLANNSELIKAHLISSANDREISEKVNGCDFFKRKGIFYLILHNNHQMIQLSIASGTILSDQTDIFGRNIIHYACLNQASDAGELLNILARCVVLENQENFDNLLNYITKSFPFVKTDYNYIDNEEELNLFLSIMNNTENIPNYKVLIEENEAKHDIPDNERLNLMFKTKIKQSVILSNNFYYDTVRENKRSIKKLINSSDIDQRTPLHYACINDNLELVKILLYYGADDTIYDKNNQKPIDLTHSEKIKLCLFTHNKNIESKQAANMLNTVNPKNNVLKAMFNLENKGSKEQINNDNNNKSLLNNTNLSKLSTFYKNKNHLDIETIKHLSEDQVKKFSVGYEKNNYLIISVIEDQYDIFTYLIKEKNSSLIYFNSNGWNILHFILKLKRWKFLAFIYNVKEEDIKDIDSKSDKKNISFICDKINSLNYSPNDILNYNTNPKSLNYKGEALILVDSVSNNIISPLFFSITNPGNVDIFKSLVNILKLRQRLSTTCSVLNNKCSSDISYILNKKYDIKLEQTLLLKATETNNLPIIKYLCEELNQDYEINLYEVDKKLQCVLHYCVCYHKNRPELINYFICLEGESSKLLKIKDFKGKTAQDYDTVNRLECYLTSIWNAVQQDNYNLVKKILDINSQTYNVNSQTLRFKNTPFHIAIQYKAYRSAFVLLNYNKENEENRRVKAVDNEVKKHNVNELKENKLKEEQQSQEIKRNQKDEILDQGRIEDKEDSKQKEDNQHNEEEDEDKIIIKNNSNEVSTRSNQLESINKLNLSLENYKSISCLKMINYITDLQSKKTFNKLVNEEFANFDELENYLINSKFSKNNGDSNMTITNSSYINSRFNKKQVDDLVDKVIKEIKNKKLNLKSIFNKLDDNKNGKLEGFEFESLFTALGLNITFDEILTLIAVADKNKDGFIDIKEFVSLFKLD